MRTMTTQRELSKLKPQRCQAERRRARTFRPATEKLEGRELLAVAIGEVPLPPGAAAGYSLPQDMIQGPDGNLWFTEASHRIGRLTPSGTMTEFPVAGNGLLGGMTAGPDGNIWFIDNPQQIYTIANLSTSSSQDSLVIFPYLEVGRITPDGAITEFALPQDQSNDTAFSITAGPDGNLWCTVGTDVDRITPSGQITEFPLPSNIRADEIVSGPDGHLWFTYGTNQIGRISTDGAVTILPTTLTGSVQQTGGMVQGPDGNFWVIVVQNNVPDVFSTSLDRVTPEGTVTEFALPGRVSRSEGPTTPFVPYVQSIATGPDGNLWVTQGEDQVIRFALDGTTTTYPTPTPGAWARPITSGPDGNIWFIESGAGRAGQVVLNAPDPAPLNLQRTASIQSTEGGSFSGTLATFSPVKPGDTPADYVARIDWGDGPTSLGTVIQDSPSSLHVEGYHSAPSEGSYSVNVTVIDVQLGDPGATATVTVPASVAEAPLTPMPLEVHAYRGQTTPILVARAGSFEQAGSYTAIIDWGDASSSAGSVSITPGPNVVLQLSSIIPAPLIRGIVSVSASHIYAVDGDYVVRTRITDETGQTATLENTVHYATPRVDAARPHDINTTAGERPPTQGQLFPWLVGEFHTTETDVPATEYSATIDWGDGSGPVQALVGGSFNGTYYVTAQVHPFTKLGTFPFEVSVLGFGQFFIDGQAHVAGQAPSFTGHLDPASDSGFSHRDGITAQTRPRFLGAAPAGTTIELFARRNGASTPVSIGHTVAVSGNRWSIVSVPLAEGVYTITANETTLDGGTLRNRPVVTGGPGGRLVVDATGPRVTAAVLDPVTSGIILVFRDNLSQVNPLGLTRPGSIQLSRDLPSGGSAVPARVSWIRPGGGAVRLSLGHPVPDGRYLLRIASGSVRDAAGNPLDGEFPRLLPSGDGRPGGSFLGQFLTRGRTLVQAKPVGSGPAPVVRSLGVPLQARRHE